MCKGCERVWVVRWTVTVTVTVTVTAAPGGPGPRCSGRLHGFRCGCGGSAGGQGPPRHFESDAATDCSPGQAGCWARATLPGPAAGCHESAAAVV